MRKELALQRSKEQQREYKQLNDLSESQLTTLCAACGWQGGTYWQVVDEIRRLKAVEAKAAAPELLQILQELRQCAINTAISKATGESS